MDLQFNYLVPILLTMLGNNDLFQNSYDDFDLNAYNSYGQNLYQPPPSPLNNNPQQQTFDEANFPFTGTLVRKIYCGNAFKNTYWHAFQLCDGRIVLTGNTESNGYSPIVNITNNDLLSNAITYTYLNVPSHYSYTRGVELPNKLIAVGSTNNYYIYLMNQITGAINATLTGSNHYSWIIQIVNSRYLCSGGQTAYIYCWDTYTNQQSVAPMIYWYAHGSQCWAMTTYNGLLVSGGIDQLVKIWKVEVGEWIRTLDSMPHYVTSLAMTHEQRIAGACYTGTVYIWDPCSGVVVNSWNIPDYYYPRLYILNSGYIALVPYNGNQAIVYDTTGKKRCIMWGHYPGFIMNDGSLAINNGDHFNVYS